MEASLGQDTAILLVIAVIAVLIVLLVGVIMLWAAVALWQRRSAAAVPVRPVRSAPEPESELDLPDPERPVEPPPQPLDRGMGAYFDSSWDDDEEAATEVAAMPPSAPPPTPPGGAPSPLMPMSADALEDADEQATEVLSAADNAELAAAVRAARAADNDIPSFGDRGGAYFDDDWDEEEAPTAVMTGDMADRYAEMLLDEDDNEDDEDGDSPHGPGRVVAKKP